uniref:Rho GTPase activating protein 12 n=1 Tax=Callorhinchus milii TaxID=7868 RepID=A0A4W3GV63_CALMI
MAEKDGKPNLPIIPGQMWIEVEYDYEYEAKDRKISIKQGEKYILVKKTNNDWWQVKKEETSKLFYLPAQYVKELPRKALMPPVKHGPSCMKSAALNVDTKPLQDSTESPYKPLDYSNSFKSSTGPLQSQPTDLDTSQIHHRDQGLLHLQTAVQDSAKTSTQSYGPGESESQYPRVPNQTWNLGAGRSQSSDSMDGENSLYDPSYEWTSESSGRQHQDSESGDEFSSSSTEQLQTPSPAGPTRPDSPVYANLQDLKMSQANLPPVPKSSPIQVLGDWEMHKDATGRTYYYNKGSQERSWKPPRGTRDSINKEHGSQGDSINHEKYGLLNVTKITDNGKKVRKNWTSSWTVLQGSSLLFAKNQGSGWKFGSNQSKPEFTVDLRGAAIEWASKDKSSKKNVLELRTRQGTELLIQLDNDATIAEWHKALEITIGNQVCVPIGHSVVKSFIIFLLRISFIHTDQVFGCNLDSLCQRENTTIPQFVKMCIDHVEKEGLDIDGLYRVSGNLAVIQKLRFAVNHDEKLDLKDSKWEDINVITGALKMFFRELPEPLFTYHLFNDFVNAIKNPDYKQRVQDIKELIRQLPKPNHDTMQILFQHLGKIVANGELNRMTTQSVAIVFGPTLLKPEKETGNIAVHMVYQNQIVELILTEYETVFGRS